MTISLIWQILALITIGYFTAQVLMGAFVLPRPARVALAITFVVIAVTAVLYSPIWANLPPFWIWFFDPNSEYALSATVSVWYFFSATAAALILGWKTGGWQRWYFLVCGFGLLVMGLDEFYSLHELYPIVSDIYIGLGIFLTVPPLYFFWRDRRNKNWLMLPLGFAGMAFGGLIIDRFTVDVMCFQRKLRFYCDNFYGVEESFEVWGTAVLMVGLIALALTLLDETARRRLLRQVFGTAAVGSFILFASFWLLPSLELRLLAEPVDVQFTDLTNETTLTLVGYRTTRDRLTPDSTLHVTYFWRTSGFQPIDYNVSTHILTQPDADTIAQQDAQLGNLIQTKEWLPGILYHQRMTLIVPPDLPTARSYGLSVSLWDDSDRYQATISHSDRPQLSDDTVVVRNLPAPPIDEIPSPPTATDYRFAAGFTLIGFDAPQQAPPGETINLRFWWQTREAVQIDLTQFIHLIPEGGVDVFGFDQPPFEGQFPTYVWPDRMRAVDEHPITLPADMPPGRYELRTGMYDWVTGERQTITGPRQTPVPDNSILLTTIIID